MNLAFVLDCGVKRAAYLAATARLQAAQAAADQQDQEAAWALPDLAALVAQTSADFYRAERRLRSQGSKTTRQTARLCAEDIAQKLQLPLPSAMQVLARHVSARVELRNARPGDLEAAHQEIVRGF